MYSAPPPVPALNEALMATDALARHRHRKSQSQLAAETARGPLSNPEGTVLPPGLTPAQVCCGAVCPFSCRTHFGCV